MVKSRPSTAFRYDSPLERIRLTPFLTEYHCLRSTVFTKTVESCVLFSGFFPIIFRQACSSSHRQSDMLRLHVRLEWGSLFCKSLEHRGTSRQICNQAED